MEDDFFLIDSIVLLAVLIFFNAIFAATKNALASLNEDNLQADFENGRKKAGKLLKMIKESSRYLATLEVMISITTLFSGAITAKYITNVVTSYIFKKTNYFSENSLNIIVFIVLTMLLSYFLMIFGEIVPKKLATKYPKIIAYATVNIINILSTILYPFIKILNLSANVILRIFGISSNSFTAYVSEEEIRKMVDVGTETGGIDSREHEMINNIFDLDNTTAEDVSVHRTDIVALSIDASSEDILRFLANEKYSRIPVYEENLDTILGILHIKDVLKQLINDGDLKTLNIRPLLREPYFVPFSKTADELFMEMQKQQVHMAVVVDEYGGTLGLVTMEDIVEEIMGNIFDEHDDYEAPPIYKIEEGTYMANGTTDLEIVDDYFDEIKLPIDEYDTLSGFMIGQLGRIPEEDEKPDLEYEGFLFKVNEVDEKRISSVVICKL